MNFRAIFSLVTNLVTFYLSCDSAKAGIPLFYSNGIIAKTFKCFPSLLTEDICSGEGDLMAEQKGSKINHKMV
jgi:hypothetical protein